MARIGGRNTAFAWLVGLASLAVVAGLVWLAAPMTPVVLAWTGQIVDGALNPRPAAPGADPSPSSTATAPPPAPAPDTETGAPTTCADLYPRALWDQLSAADGSSVDESIEFPPSSVAGLPEAFGAQVKFGCAWTDAGGSTMVAVSDVGTGAAATAQSVLAATGFACTALEDGVRCDLPAGDQSAAETHVLRGGQWLAVVRTFPGPPFDQASAEARVWP